MSGDVQARKRKGKGKKKGSQQVVQLEEIEFDRRQPKIISYDFEDDVIDSKAHNNNNTPHHTKNNNKAASNDEGGSSSSGVVAKAIFLLLLVSLSVVVALILVELRGKQKAAMEENVSASSGAGEEIAPPPLPPPPPAVMPLQDEGSVPPEASISQDAEDEEPEALATPPLEEFVKVVREVDMEPLPDEAPVQPEAKMEEEEVVLPKEEERVEDASTVDEVVEVVTPVEEVVAPVEEAVQVPSPTPAADVDEEEVPLADDSKPTTDEVVEEKEDATSEEPVEEPDVARVVEPLEVPVPTQQEEEKEEEVVEPPVEQPDASDDSIKEELETAPLDDEDEEEEEEASDVQKPAVKEEEVLQEKEEEEEEEEDWSQYGKEGNTGALTEAYLKVESLAEEIMALDPKNAMVGQVAPHMAGVLRAMEEGQTEGLLETLNHIQVILEDVKNRIEEDEETAKEPPVEAAEEKQPQPPSAEKDAATGADENSIIDNEIKEELNQAEKLLPENPGKALHTFGALLHRNPKSARAIYGRARSLDQLAEIEKSNSKLEQAILTYRSILDLADEEPSLVPLDLLRAAAERCIDRMKFRGFFGKALRVQQRLLQRFPEDVDLRNSMGVTFLLMNQGSAAKEVFEAVLQQWPDDGFAQVHFGFVLKTTYNNVTGGAYYMKKGIDSGAAGTQDERFFFHLGDALQRQGKVEEAYKIYDEAVERGMFLSRYQRSLYNVDRLTSRPFWTLEQTTYQMFFRKLEENWEVIRNEGVALLGLPVQDGFRPEAENLKDIGDWKQYELYTKGRKITANCVKTPRTCSLIEDFPAAAGCKRGQVKFSVMQPHTHVHAHTGPTNCRLRAHLGLVVPKGVHLKVGQETTTWEEGKFLIFDDSWEHEVWHEGDSFRLVLIVDVWHPELTEQERKTLSPI
ncbi:aspartyl/asparaginyl beta-hydroxylase-like isoform X4 [Eriocheir sinensis]|uniref:aspartyl/asparaginyl beta-hydroxylase-like isoform X4 n=1 Tax=Eriocheir sinensis TaxID=95602 RepID=UPI0021CAE183|nr:aspartyl/asparaginyl beta-hydroxylase-like isoform X4 [Eriocheir sinensis]